MDVDGEAYPVVITISVDIPWQVIECAPDAEELLDLTDYVSAAAEYEIHRTIISLREHGQ